MRIRIISAGLAGCEAALQLANRNILVDLYEMKPIRHSEAHVSNNYAESEFMTHEAQRSTIRLIPWLVIFAII